MVNRRLTLHRDGGRGGRRLRHKVEPKRARRGERLGNYDDKIYSDLLDEDEIQ